MDCFVKLNENSAIEIISNENLINILNESWVEKIYWEVKSELFRKIKIFEKIDYSSIIKEIKLDNLKQIDALYIKKPNIS
jgi:hypothetical protein